MSADPSVEDVLAVPAQVLEVAPPAWQDGNGHVNVRHFYDLHLRGAAAALEDIGLDDAYRASTGQSVFSVEQHIRFLGEVLVGDEVSVHMLWLERGDKVVHGLSLVLDRTRGRLVNTLEVLEAHVDLGTRRACAWAPALAERIDERTRTHAGLPWVAPLVGAVGVRR